MNRYLLKTLSVLILAGWTSAASAATPSVSFGEYGGSVLTWCKKNRTTPSAPGNNRFSPANVYVDAQGLHLTIRLRNG